MVYSLHVTFGIILDFFAANENDLSEEIYT